MVDARPTSLLPHRIASAMAGPALAYGSLWLCLRNLGQTGTKEWIFWVPVALLLGQRPESRAAIHST